MLSYPYITEALFKAGLKEEAVKMLKRYWGKMIELGADTYWEAFDPDQPDNSHTVHHSFPATVIPGAAHLFI